MALNWMFFLICSLYKHVIQYRMMYFYLMCCSNYVLYKHAFTISNDEFAYVFDYSSHAPIVFRIIDELHFFAQHMFAICDTKDGFIKHNIVILEICIRSHQLRNLCAIMIRTLMVMICSLLIEIVYRKR